MYLSAALYVVDVPTKANIALPLYSARNCEISARNGIEFASALLAIKLPTPDVVKYYAENNTDLHTER